MTRGPTPSPVQTIRHVIDPLAIVPVPRLELTVRREAGAECERLVVFDGDECRIGTHPSNDVVLNDPTVSRFHCRLTRDKSAWRVTDSGSLNGTRLEGVLVRDADVGSQGTLTIGDSSLFVKAAETAQKSVIPMVPAFGSLVGTSPAMRKLFGMLEKVAASDINVLVHGESGTGKELVANEIVQRSARKDKPFIIVDCGAISPNLVESELFGHVRGAFTGADRDRVGAFELADGGTVFLDEIGELPLDLQPKLLRALEAKEIRRVGDGRVRKVDVRVICATHRDLDREVNRGRFREDLYFRLAVIRLNVPPLRDRVEDLAILIRVFLGALSAEHEEKRLFGPEVVARLSKYDWPGNVRELRNYIERSVVLDNADLALETRSGGQAPAPSSDPPQSTAEPTVPFKIAKDRIVTQFERAYLTTLLAKTGGNMSEAARQAGIDRMYLHRLAQKYGLRGGNQGG